jgi:polyisoprenyl-phosphate glycosyltransferase
MMVMAEDVLVRVGVCCSAVVVLTLTLLATSLVLKLAGQATPGWFTAASGILILMLMQAAVLIFVTLMITGIMRGAAPNTQATLDRLINSVEKTQRRLYHQQSTSA